MIMLDAVANEMETDLGVETVGFLDSPYVLDKRGHEQGTRPQAAAVPDIGEILQYVIWCEI